mgnify:CR=1 FL=1
MKNHSVSIRSLLGPVLALLMLAFVFNACNNDDGPEAVPVDKTRLKARLDSANATYTAAQEGVTVGSYEAGSKATFKTAIDAATTVYNNANATQTEVNNAWVNLGQAVTTFQSKQVQEIAPQNLVLYLKMDGNANDASGRGFNGTLRTGNTKWGGGTVTPTKDRYGRDAQAYFFDKGAHIEIPYNPVLNPAKELTISLWARPTQVRPSNYMVSLGRWYGYKLQLQEANKAFMTVRTGPERFIDKDNESPTLDLNKWYHIAVSYKSGEMVFYINGTPVKTWTDVTGDLFPVRSTTNLAIGQDLPNGAYTLTDAKDADGIQNFVDWGGFFTGDMDEVRIYNVVLSGTQVRSIYNAEKP